MFENDNFFNEVNEEDMINKEVEMNVEIEKVRFYNEENNYHAMVASTDKNVIGSKYQYGKYIITLVGHCVTCTEGDHCKVIAKLIKHPKYGYQYEIVNLGFETPMDKNALKTYLSAIIDGAKAEVLYNAYPDIVNRVMEDPEFEPEYSILKGIAKKTWVRIRNKIIENFGYNELITLMAPTGCTLTMIKRIAANEKNLGLVKEKIIKNPYVLCQFPRMGFKKVDGYAIKLNPNLIHSKVRVTQCISYILNKIANDDGHCYIDIKKLKELFKKEILDSDILPVFDEVIEDNRRATEEGIKSEFYVSNDSIGLTSVNVLESGIMRILDEIQHRDIIWEYDYKTLFERMEESAKEQGFYLSEEQTSAVRSVAYNNVNIFSGKAGTGKSSVIKTILSVYRNKRVAMCALSAKAAKRITEVTGMYASTIHRLLNVQFNGEENSGFLYNASNPLPYDLIIVDECSMNNIYLLHALLKAVSKTAKIIFCGDIAQLPSIGTGSVFTDLVQNPIFNNHSFTKVYRQSEESFINTHANLIREGIMPFDIDSGNMKFGEDTMYLFRNESEDVRNTAVSLYLEFLNRGYDITDVGIICPRKNNCCVSCSSLNNIIQHHLLGNESQQIILGKVSDSEDEEDSEQKVFKLGARIINKKNDYKKGILNGDTGTVVSIDPKGTSFTVKFDNDNLVDFTRSEMATLELGYAISVHSSQGSQYKACIVAMDMSSYTLLSSNLIYTAITRAINMMIVCSQPSAFSRAVTNTKENFRNTYLKNMLNDKSKKEYISNFAQQTMFHRPIIDDETKNIYISEGVIKLATDNPFSYEDSELPF